MCKVIVVREVNHSSGHPWQPVGCVCELICHNTVRVNRVDMAVFPSKNATAGQLCSFNGQGHEGQANKMAAGLFLHNIMKKKYVRNNYKQALLYQKRKVEGDTRSKGA